MRTLDERAQESAELEDTRRIVSGNIPVDTSDFVTVVTDDVTDGAIEARKAERRELARALHDTVVQPLTALLISMETLAQPSASDVSHGDVSHGDVSQAQLDAWKALAREAMQSLRSTMAGLRTHPHAQLGLPDALRRHLAPQVESRGLHVTVQASGWPEELPEDWTTSLYLTVREALMNAEKHARASQCVVLLRSSARQICITIVDDGVGFTHKRTAHAQPTAQGTGFGIGGMRDRVRSLGGRLTLTTAPGCGTRIEITIPRPVRASVQRAARDMSRRSTLVADADALGRSNGRSVGHVA